MHQVFAVIFIVEMIIKLIALGLIWGVVTQVQEKRKKLADQWMKSLDFPEV